MHKNARKVERKTQTKICCCYTWLPHGELTPTKLILQVMSWSHGGCLGLCIAVCQVYKVSVYNNIALNNDDGDDDDDDDNNSNDNNNDKDTGCFCIFSQL